MKIRVHPFELEFFADQDGTLLKAYTLGGMYSVHQGPAGCWFAYFLRWTGRVEFIGSAISESPIWALVQDHYSLRVLEDFQASYALGVELDPADRQPPPPGTIRPVQVVVGSIIPRPPAPRGKEKGGPDATD